MKNQIDLLFNKTSETFAEKIYDYYISHIDERHQTLRKAYIAIFTDSVIKCPTFYFGKNLTQFSSGNKVYFYEFLKITIYTIFLLFFIKLVVKRF
jgi:hypothetical protein